MKINLSTLDQALTSVKKYKNIIVGFSGGIDSTVLLYGVCLLARKGLLRSNIKAIHVNHGLNDSCEEWESFCRRICSAYNVDLQVKNLEGLQKGSDHYSEGFLRTERYREFESVLNPDSVLLLAHHQDDQIETLLLRLNRGSGMRGLSGIPKRRSLGEGSIYRPLLNFDRNSISEFAKKEGLKWIEDSSNAETCIDRNFLRSEVLPKIESRWPNYRESWYKSLTLINEACLAEEKQAQQDIVCLTHRSSESIDLTELVKLSPKRQRGVLKYWCLANKNVELGWNKLHQIVSEFLPAAIKTSTHFKIGVYKLSSFQGALHIVPTEELELLGCTWDLKESDEIALKNNGVLKAKEVGSGGFSLKPNSLLDIKYRKGGEVLKTAEGRSKTLKKILQEAGVQPWERARIPLVYQQEELISVVGICVCQKAQASHGQKGYSITWLKP